MKIWGVHKKYHDQNWFENFMSGCLTIGNMTIFGENASNWIVEIDTTKNHLCFTLPTWRRITGKDEWYIYLSPDSTIPSSHWFWGSKTNHADWTGL